MHCFFHSLHSHATAPLTETSAAKVLSYNEWRHRYGAPSKNLGYLTNTCNNQTNIAAHKHKGLPTKQNALILHIFEILHALKASKDYQSIILTQALYTLCTNMVCLKLASGIVSEVNAKILLRVCQENRSIDAECKSWATSLPLWIAFFRLFNRTSRSQEFTISFPCLTSRSRATPRALDMLLMLAVRDCSAKSRSFFSAKFFMADKVTICWSSSSLKISF